VTREVEEIHQILPSLPLSWCQARKWHVAPVIRESDMLFSRALSLLEDNISAKEYLEVIRSYSLYQFVSKPKQMKNKIPCFYIFFILSIEIGPKDIQMADIWPFFHTCILRPCRVE